MKRILAIVLGILVCAGMAGCRKTPKEPLLTLGAGEFDLYENGEIVVKAEDIPLYTEYGAISLYLENLGFDGEPILPIYTRDGNTLDLSGRDITTKRGIGIGSTMEEVAMAYEGVSFSLMLGLGDYENEISIEEIARKAGRDKGETVFSAETFVMKDGKMLTVKGYIDDFLPTIDKNPASALSYLADWFDWVYELGFAVEGGVVTEIWITDVIDTYADRADTAWRKKVYPEEYSEDADG